MRSNLVRRLVTRTVVAVTLLLSAWAVTGTTAQAQGRWHGRGFDRPNRVFVQPRVFISPQPRVFIRPRVFVGPRVGFYSGAYSYPGAYSSYVPYGGVAYQEEQGYRDGVSRGRDDARHGEPYSPNSHSHYRSASSFAYRDAFIRGYDVGFREYAG
jgi:hypothetical protein